MAFQYERDSFLDDLIMDGDYEGAPRLRSRAKERASRNGRRRGRRARPYGELSPIQNLLLGGQAQLGGFLTGSPGTVAGAPRDPIPAGAAAELQRLGILSPSGTMRMPAPVAITPGSTTTPRIETPMAVPPSLGPSTPGPSVTTPTTTSVYPGGPPVPVSPLLGAGIGGALGGPAGALLGAAMGAAVNPSTLTPGGPGSVASFRVDPGLQSAVADLRSRIDFAATQREATNEHRTINSEVEFRREVLRLLTAIRAKLPNGALKSKVSRSIRILVG